MTGHVPAVRVPPDHTASSRPAVVRARGNVEERRDLDPAPSAHRPATQSAVPPEADLGGPGPFRDPAQRDTESASSGAAVAGHSGHDPALAPRPRPPPPGRPVHARQDRPPGDPPEHQGTGPPAGQGESGLGLPQDPRRARWPGSEGSAAASLHQSWRILECVCPEEIARQRIKEQSALGVHPAGNRNYRLYLEVRSRFEAISLPKTMIDTSQPLPDCVEQALAALR